MLAMHVIESAHTVWASPVVFAPSKDGTLRICVDYRMFYAVTIRNLYTLPRMDKCRDSLEGAHIFSALDANSDYGEAKIDESDKKKTACNSYHDLYQVTRMLFGLKIPPCYNVS